MSPIFIDSWSSLRSLGCLIVATAVFCAMAGRGSAQNQGGTNDPADFAWQKQAIDHAQRMRGYFAPDNGQQQTPPVIPRFETDPDPFGGVATIQPAGPTQDLRKTHSSPILAPTTVLASRAISHKLAGVSALRAYKSAFTSAAATIRSFD